MAVAFVYLDPSTPGGAVVPSSTGWVYNIGIAFRDSTSGKKESLTGVQIPVTDVQASTLANLGAALSAAVKAKGLERGFDVTVVVLPQSVLLSV